MAGAAEHRNPETPKTAKENDLNPFSHLKHLFERLPATDSSGAIDKPWSESVRSAVKA